MTMMRESERADFWTLAPHLFEVANQTQAALSRSNITDEVRSGVQTLAAAIPEAPDSLAAMDPYLTRSLLQGVVHAMRAELGNDRPALRVALERIRQSLRDLLDERPVWQSGPKNAVMWLKATGIPMSDLAEVLDASETSIRRWASREDPTEPSDDKADRVMVVAKIVNHLRHAMTARGVVQWLQRPHPALEYRRPIDELKDASSYERLVHLASGSRSFVAT